MTRDHMTPSVSHAGVAAARNEIALQVIADARSTPADVEQAQRALLAVEPNVELLDEREILTLESLLSKACGEASTIELHVVAADRQHTHGSSCDRGKEALAEAAIVDPCPRCERFSDSDLDELAAALVPE